MKYLSIAFLVLGLVLGAEAQVQSAGFLMPAGKTVAPEFKDTQFNRYTTKNFVINSLDDGQAKWLVEHVEGIKSWSLDRWGFNDRDLKHEVRVFCVPTKEVLNKLFKIETSSLEVFRKPDGQIEVIGVWLALDEKPSEVIPQFVTAACLADLEAQEKVQMGWWAHKGICGLNSSNVREMFAMLGENIVNDDGLFFAQKMLTMTEAEYNAMSPKHRLTFDVEAMAMCLLFRKELGEARLHSFLRTTGESGLQSVYGYSGYAEFDKSFHRYLVDLTSDVLQKKTPDEYLKITRAP